MADFDREGIFAPLVDEAAGFLGDGLSVHVVGPHGSGRSEILGLVADRLDDEGWTVLRLYGNPAWRQEPFAALVAAGIGPASAPGPRRSVGEMSTALTQQLRGGRVVIVCDDADDLDLQSVGALLTVHQQRRLLAVTASRPHLPVRPDSLMLGLTPAVRLRTPVLDVDGVHALCRSILGGPVDAAAVARITMKSGGLPGLVRAIATVSRRAGTLRLRDGVWSLPGDLWSEHLAAAVQHYLSGAEQAVWDGATTLALTGPVRLEEAEKLLDRTVLDRLFTAGLVHHSDDRGAGVVGLFPPLLAEYLRREGSPFGLAHARDLTDRGDILPAAYDGRGSFDAGQAVGADAAVLNQRAARLAAEAVTQARRAWQVEPSPRTAQELLVALRATAAPASEIEFVGETTPLGEDETTAMLVLWRAHWYAVDRNDLPGALALLSQHESALPRYTALLRAAALHLTYLRDHAPDLAEVGLVDPGDEPRAREALACVRAEILLSAGLVDRARAELADVPPAHSTFVIDAGILTGLADVVAGNLEAGIRYASDQLLASLHRNSTSEALAQSYVAVLGLVLSGRLGDAAQLLFRTLSMTTLAAFREIFRTGVLVLGAEIAIGQGRAEYARALAAQASATKGGRGPYPGMDPTVVAGLLDDAPTEARARLWDVVTERLEAGYVLAAVLLAVEAVERAPDPERAAQIQQRAAATESPLLRALGDYVTAAADADESALAEVEERLDARGAGLYAVRASVTRALVLRHQGRTVDAAAQADRAWEMSAIVGYDRAGVFARLQEDVGLSSRELEIIAMISARRTTAEVANDLQMSIRTVETHLHNVSRKIGVSGREMLVRAATTWLRPAQH